MTCTSCQNELPDYLLTKETVSKDAFVTEHLAACETCREELSSLRETMQLLDTWTAPEPSAYFDQKMAVLLREEQAKPQAGWLERIREHLLFNTGRQFRPMLAGGLVLAMMLGVGGFFGVSNWNHVEEAKVSATVNDLQILDKDEQAIQQMDQLLQDDDGDDGDSAPPVS